MFLGIFTGIEVLFFMLGVLTTLAVGCLAYMKLRFPLKWNSLVLTGLGLFTIIAAVAWSVSSESLPI